MSRWDAYVARVRRLPREPRVAMDRTERIEGLRRYAQACRAAGQLEKAAKIEVDIRDLEKHSR